MKLLTRELPATSLLETIVSSVIFMIIFIIAIHSITHLLAYETKQPNWLIIENDMKKCRRIIEKEGVNESRDARYYSFSWGSIRVSATPYKDNILQVEMSSEIESGQSISYYFLHVNQ